MGEERNSLANETLDNSYLLGEGLISSMCEMTGGEHYVCMYVCMCMMYVCVGMYVCTCVYVCVHVCMYVCACVCMYYVYCVCLGMYV